MYQDKSMKIIVSLISVLIVLVSGIYILIVYKGSPLSKVNTDVAENIKETNSGSNGISGYANLKIDTSRIQILGVLTDKVEEKRLIKSIRTVGIVTVDETKVSIIQSKFKGWIEKLFVDFVGMPVEKGEKLFTVYSPDLLATQEEFLLAIKELELLKEGKFANELKLFSINLLKSARRRLELWDVPSDEINRLEKNRQVSKNLIFRSPIKGIVLSKKAFIGMNVEPGMEIFTIADLSNIWVLADIYEDEIRHIKLGQDAKLKISSFPSKSFTGKATFVDYVLEGSTRTVKVRFEFENSELILKPDMYATVEINLDMGKNLAISEESIIDTGERKIVFVSAGKGLFEPREVKLGFKAGRFYQVLSGVDKGDLVVVSAQFLLDSESRLRSLETGTIKKDTLN